MLSAYPILIHLLNLLILVKLGSCCYDDAVEIADKAIEQWEFSKEFIALELRYFGCDVGVESSIDVYLD